MVDVHTGWCLISSHRDEECAAISQLKHVLDLQQRNNGWSEEHPLQVQHCDCHQCAFSRAAHLALAICVGVANQHCAVAIVSQCTCLHKRSQVRFCKSHCEMTAEQCTDLLAHETAHHDISCAFCLCNRWQSCIVS